LTEVTIFLKLQVFVTWYCGKFRSMTLAVVLQGEER